MVLWLLLVAKVLQAATAYQHLALYCLFAECCGKEKLLNVSTLKLQLEEKLLGQHLAKEVILKALTDFKSNRDPKEPWTLSLCGWAGTGKNFVSQIVAENLHSKGLKGNLVHLFVLTPHFPHEHQMKLHQDQLQRWVQGNVRAYASSMFICDEMHELNPRITVAIKPLLGYYEQVGGVSYWEVIFIFLSMAGGDIITKTDLEFWQAGRKCEDIQPNNLECVQSVGVCNDKHSGLGCSRLMETSDDFSPFLPLKHTHGKMYVWAEMRA